MKLLISAALLVSATIAYDGHFKKDKKDDLVLEIVDFMREISRGFTFGLEGDRYKKPSQSACVGEVDGFWYGIEDAYYDIVLAIEGESGTNWFGAIMAIVNIVTEVWGGGSCQYWTFLLDFFKILFSAKWWKHNFVDFVSNWNQMFKYVMLFVDALGKANWFLFGASLGELIAFMFNLSLH
jgi:hypothetical protein